MADEAKAGGQDIRGPEVRVAPAPEAQQPDHVEDDVRQAGEAEVKSTESEQQEQEPDGAVDEDDEGSEADQIRALLIDGYTFQQIRDQFGFAKSTIRKEIKRRIKPEGTPNGELSKTDQRRLAKVDNKPMPAESMVSELVLPEMRDGAREVFNAGVQFGVRSIIFGVKLAQDLSAMAIQQSSPLIKMAQEMRASEGKAAEAAARQAAQEAVGGVVRYFEDHVLPEKVPPAPVSGDPFRQMLADAMKPLIQNVVNSMMPRAPGEMAAPPGYTRRKAKEGE